MVGAITNFHSLEQPPPLPLGLPRPSYSHVVLEETVNHVGQGHVIK